MLHFQTFGKFGTSKLVQNQNGLFIGKYWQIWVTLKYTRATLTYSKAKWPFHVLHLSLRNRPCFCRSVQAAAASKAWLLHTRLECQKIVHIPKLHFKVKPTKRPRKKNQFLKDKIELRLKNGQNLKKLECFFFLSSLFILNNDNISIF